VFGGQIDQLVDLGLGERDERRLAHDVVGA